MVKDRLAVDNTDAAVRKRALTPAQYGDLAEVPPELEWLANITNPKTRRAYKIGVSEFSAFAGLDGPTELRTVARAHVPLNPNSIYRNIILKYGLESGISAEVNGFCVHSLRATAATNALSHKPDIAKVQEWLGHANVSSTRLYDRRKTRPKDSPTFRVRY